MKEAETLTLVSKQLHMQQQLHLLLRPGLALRQQQLSQAGLAGSKTGHLEESIKASPGFGHTPMVSSRSPVVSPSLCFSRDKCIRQDSYKSNRTHPKNRFTLTFFGWGFLVWLRA